jgi:hypothetical protein
VTTCAPAAPRTRPCRSRLLAEIREQGYAGSMNLLYRYITQGRVEADRPHLSPKSVTPLLLTRPDALSDSQRSLLAGLTAACPEMTDLAQLVRSFAALLRPDPANEARLQDWAETARACDLPSIHASPAAWTWTSRPSSLPSPCHSITAGPRA